MVGDSRGLVYDKTWPATVNGLKTAPLASGTATTQRAGPAESQLLGAGRWGCTQPLSLMRPSQSWHRSLPTYRPPLESPLAFRAGPINIFPNGTVLYCRFHLVCPGIKFGERNFFWAWYKLKLICVLCFHFVPSPEKVSLAKFYPWTNQVQSTIQVFWLRSKKPIRPS